MKMKRKRFTGVLLALCILFSMLTGFDTAAFADTPATQTWTGWIIDRDCIGVIPVNHSKGCNLMGATKTLPATGCYNSGLGIYTNLSNANGNSALSDYLVFDGPSKELAKTLLNSLPSTWTKNITIRVTGYTVNNIPAGGTAGQKGYEARVPETDPSQVTHYISGIHITKIEAAYIDGVSTNALPSPNTEVSAVNAIGLSTQVSGNTSVIAGQNADFNFKLKDFSNVSADLNGGIYAQDLTIYYDPAVADYVSSAALVDGIQVIDTDTSVAGSVRIVIASPGSDKGISSDKNVIKLTLKPKAFSKLTYVSLSNPLVADGLGTEYLLGSSAFSFKSYLKTGDLNGDNKITIGDLAIVAYNYGKSSSHPDWKNASSKIYLWIADTDDSGNIDIIDLASSASKILGK